MNDDNRTHSGGGRLPENTAIGVMATAVGEPRIAIGGGRREPLGPIAIGPGAHAIEAGEIVIDRGDGTFARLINVEAARVLQQALILQPALGAVLHALVRSAASG